MILRPALVRSAAARAPAVPTATASWWWDGGGRSVRYFAAAASDLFTDAPYGDKSPKAQAASGLKGLAIPRRIRQKVVSAEDAVALVRDNDTVSVSGFVAQGAPEAILKALGQRYKDTKEPKNLTLLFGYVCAVGKPSRGGGVVVPVLLGTTTNCF
jgi:hypothetical protein